jgi:hypothetical protein
VRVGSHDGYGRIAFALPPRTEYQLTQQDQHVVIQFTGGLKIGPANAIPRNVVAINGGSGQATLDIAPGTVLHDWRYGDLLVVDVQDPGTKPATSSVQATAAAPRPDTATPGQAKGQQTKPDQAKPPSAQPDAGKPLSAKPDTSAPLAPKPIPAASSPDGMRAPTPPATAVAPIRSRVPLRQTRRPPVRHCLAHSRLHRSPMQRRLHRLKLLPPPRRPRQRRCQTTSLAACWTYRPVPKLGWPCSG